MLFSLSSRNFHDDALSLLTSQLCERVLRREKFKRNLLYSEANVFDLQRELGQDPLIVLPRLERAAQMVCRIFLICTMISVGLQYFSGCASAGVAEED